MVALVWANSPYAASYHELWKQHLTIGIGAFTLEHDLHYWINDGLMVLFFLYVGLEIKREVQVGELASLRLATLPIAAAIGGMVIPALLYASVNLGGEYQHGWGVPMATDIAFAIGILSLLGPRVPLGLKVFLTALAIVDDLGAVLVIAVFYSSNLNWAALAVVVGLVAVLALFRRLHIRLLWPYLLVGMVLWYAMLQSGVHATIAGVLLALTIPTKTRIDLERYLEEVEHGLETLNEEIDLESEVLRNPRLQEAVHHLELACVQVTPPLQRLEHALKPWVAFAIMPIFALSNAGVTFGGDLGAALGSTLSIGVILGLVLGKPIGIVGASWLSVKLGWAELPRETSWMHLAGAGALGGIGFTMALFVAGLAFGHGATLDIAKIGILAASALAALIGSAILVMAKPGHGGTEVPESVTAGE